MATTELAVIEQGAYPALTRTVEEVQEILADTLGDEELSELDLPRVVLPGGGGTRWEVPLLTGIDSMEELTGVIVGHKRTRAYWINPDPSGEQPDCKAEDAKTGVPNARAEAQGAGGVCKACPMNAWGSSLKSENGKACSEKELWFLLQAGSFLPMVLALPATSLRPARDHRLRIGNAMMRLTDVVTTVGLTQETGPSGKYSIAVPRIAAQLDPADAKAARAYAESLAPVFARAAAGATVDSTPPPPASDLPSEPVEPERVPVTDDDEPIPF